jgi:hypothetical protein
MKKWTDFCRENKIKRGSLEEQMLQKYLLAIRLWSCRKLMAGLLSLN